MADKRPPIKPASRREFRETLEKFAEEQKADLRMVELEQCRLILRDAMTFSPPMPKGGGKGLSIAAQKAGKNKLGNDVRRIFIPQDTPRAMPVLLRQVINAVKGNDIDAFRNTYDKFSPAKARGLSPVMRKIMEDTSWTRAMAKARNYLSKANIFGQVRQIAGTTTDPRPIHDKYKNAVGGRWKRNQPVGGPQYFVPTEAMLLAYIAERQLKVGFVKAGYADALAKVPMPKNKAGVPRNYGAYDAPWVDANKAGFGTFTEVMGKNFVNAIVGNNIGNINNVADESDVKNIVYGNRVQNLLATAKARQDAAIRRANRRK